MPQVACRASRGTGRADRVHRAPSVHRHVTGAAQWLPHGIARSPMTWRPALAIFASAGRIAPAPRRPGSARTRGGSGKNPHTAFETRPACSDRSIALPPPSPCFCCTSMPLKGPNDGALPGGDRRECRNRTSAYQVISDCRTLRFRPTILALHQPGDRARSAARTGALSVTAGRAVARDITTATASRRPESANKGVPTSVLNCGGTRCAHPPSC